MDDVSLEIDDGEFMVLVGPSGCGKTTILRLVAGLEEVTAARSSSATPVTDLPPKDRDMAMVFQNYALYPHMTVAREPRVRPQVSAARRRTRASARVDVAAGP